VQLVFDTITRWSRLLFGSKQILPLEELCLRAWRHSLAEQSRAILDRQIEQASYIERQARGAKVIFRYPSGKPDVLFANAAPDQVAAIVVFGSRADARPQREFGARIFVHRGRLFSIEFPKQPDRLLEKHTIAIDDLHVVRVEPGAALDVARG